MSTLFGPIRQNGYVVRDIEAAMKHWTDVMCIGPFFHVERLRMVEHIHRGTPSELEISCAWANSGDLQIELVQQLNDAPSTYKEFLDARGEGFHHVSFWTTTFEKDLQRGIDCGLSVLSQGKTTAEGGFAYFEQEAHPGTLIELTDNRGIKGGIWDHIRDTSATWGGAEPIRQLGG